MQKKINAYCEAHTTLPLPELYELERETHLRTLSPQMISGKVQGHLLALLTLLAKPKLALEIGTFTGYASLCIAKGLPEGGMLHTIEVNPELAFISTKYFEKTHFSNKITLHQGDAKQIIPNLGLYFDLVFMDAAKFDYPAYFDLLIDRLNPGGLLIADNVLWDGKVAAKATDADTQTIDAFNKMVHQDSRVENVILPVRDGVLVARKL
ncbi:MAG: O-methyltransferase [Saprospiraceae bacterium]|nr:O-methyltransferase [Saprospiraceae bacterium]